MNFNRRHLFLNYTLWSIVASFAIVVMPIIEIGWYDCKLILEDSYPVMYGFPLPYRSQVPYIYTMHGKLNLINMILDIGLWSICVFFILLFSEKIMSKFKTIKYVLKLIIVLWFLISVFSFSIIDWTTLVHDHYKPNYSLHIDRLLHFDREHACW